MADPSAAGESRRRFLRRVGTTLAAGVGLAAFGADRSGARPHRGTNACAIFCTPLCGQQPCPGRPELLLLRRPVLGPVEGLPLARVLELLLQPVRLLSPDA
jgi:hypothetical protein